MANTIARYRQAFLILVLAALSGAWAGHAVHVYTLHNSLAEAARHYAPVVQGIDVNDVRFQTRISKQYILVGEVEGVVLYYTLETLDDGTDEYGSALFTFYFAANRWHLWDRALMTGQFDREVALRLFEEEPSPL